MLDALKQMDVAGFRVEGILHVGANEGQERNDYAANGASPCLYVEPVDSAFAILKANLADLPFHTAIQAVCAERAGDAVLFNVASNDGQSSSLFALGAHAEHHPDIVYTGVQRMVTTTVDQIVAEHSPGRVPNLLVVDAQGADLRVLRGATGSLPHVDGVYVEVSQTPLYEGGCTLEEITAFLRGFDLHPHWLQLNAVGHGEAFYCRPQPPYPALPLFDGVVSVGKPAAQSSYCEWSHFDVADSPSGCLNGAPTGRPGFHTDIEDAPWWQVDLEAVRALNEVRVFNRMDSARERSRTLRVLLSDDGVAWRLVHVQAGHTFGGADGRPLRVMLGGERARFVRLQLTERTYLHLDKVFVL
ncbi:FkbM family methyltransferase [Methylobacterium sp. NEAU 140]|uniref:FkbM family methyltransferase n=1 Tax=Methylobacterium sp. NEAU 140 TaxID=3064945 RepID=UPI002734C58A|nr:FkbM family methyltransferase [Methylobacterium sp. NEAU 140]MDP4023887.1 FkbM family methyltransferase [Methylobacterium sp. NEAU 140]